MSCPVGRAYMLTVSPAEGSNLTASKKIASDGEALVLEF